MKYVLVRDSDSKVVGLYATNNFVVPEGHTVYEEEYTGPIYWNSQGTAVYRDGVENYRTEYTE